MIQISFTTWRHFVFNEPAFIGRSFLIETDTVYIRPASPPRVLFPPPQNEPEELEDQIREAFQALDDLILFMP